MRQEEEFHYRPLRESAQKEEQEAFEKTLYLRNFNQTNKTNESTRRRK